jgi:uncharacterized protein (TIGR02757 family)
LDTLYDEFNAAHTVADPVWFAHRFSAGEDREVVAFIAAALAFGRVQSVLNSIAGMLAVMGASPAAFVRAFDPSRDRKRFDHLVHRWTNGPDFAALVWILHQMIEQSGAIENFFAEGLPEDAVDISAGLQSFSTRALAMDVKPIYGRRKPRPGVAYFFSRPSSGGACKRLNLFLRWMVRDDKVDLGVWSKVRPGQLIVPLDTHVIRVGQCLQLTTLKSPGWRMAADITASLRAIDPADPIKFDFSICHLGMMNACGFGKGTGDTRCPLKGACHPGAVGPERDRGARARLGRVEGERRQGPLRRKQG